jgi:Phenylalanyl-tRNA synthetase beta subunit
MCLNSQPVRRDIAVVVDQKIEVQALLDELREGSVRSGLQDVQKVALFDEFRPKSNTSGGLAAHEKSLAFRVTLQDTGGTLQDETVDLAIQTLWNVWLEYMAHGCVDNPHLTIARLFPHPLFSAWRAI